MCYQAHWPGPERPAAPLLVWGMAHTLTSAHRLGHVGRPTAYQYRAILQCQTKGRAPRGNPQAPRVTYPLRGLKQRPGGTSLFFLGFSLFFWIFLFVFHLCFIFNLCKTRW